MKVFLDTNVILEYFAIREEYETVQSLYQHFYNRHDTLYMSVGSFYTIVFLIERVLKKEAGLKGETRIKALRDIMGRILRTILVAEHDNDSLLRGISDVRFDDLEDSCQYELACKAECDFLITFNIGDFTVKNDSAVRVLTPKEFLATIESEKAL